MTTTFSDEVLDGTLEALRTRLTTLHVCTAAPTTVAEATGSLSMASASVTLGASGPGTPDGREASTSAVSGVAVSAAGTATHWALVKASAPAVLLASGPFTEVKACSLGETMDIDPITIHQPAT